MVIGIMWFQGQANAKVSKIPVFWNYLFSLAQEASITVYVALPKNAKKTAIMFEWIGLQKHVRA